MVEPSTTAEPSLPSPTLDVFKNYVYFTVLGEGTVEVYFLESVPSSAVWLLRPPLRLSDLASAFALLSHLVTRSLWLT